MILIYKVMRKLLAIPALVLFLTCQLFAGEPDKEFHERCLYPTVMVQASASANVLSGEKSERKSIGSGVIFKSYKSKDGKFLNFVLTCNHVIHIQRSLLQRSLFPMSYVVKKANYKNWSTFVGYTTYNCRVIHKDVKNDCAIVVFESDKKMHTAVLDADPKLYIGNDIFRVGCGLGDVMRVDHGKVTSVNFTLKGFVKDVYRMSVATIGGDSGGPVFHETKDGYKVFSIAQGIRAMQNASRVPLSRGYLEVPVRHPLTHIAFATPLKRMGDLESFCQKKITCYRLSYY